MLVATVILYNNGHATILTVNNNTPLPGSPGTYTTITAAVAAAFAGDTILVNGSPNSYGSCIINKKLTILGPGYNPQRQTTQTAIASFTLTNGSSYTRIEGFYNLGIGCNATALVTGVVIARNTVNISLQGTSVSYFTNCLIINNIIYSNCPLNYCGGITFANNIFTGGGSIGQINLSSVIIKNNLFLNGTGFSDGVWPVSNAVFSNNIFYEANLGGTTQSVGTLCTFNNNLTYNCVNNNNTLPYGSNVGSGNIINQDPVFLNVTGSPFALTNNYMVHTSSPCKNAGTDGTDIGPSGGSYPFTNIFPLSGMPEIPFVKSMNINGPSSVPVGNATINVTVKGQKHD